MKDFLTFVIAGGAAGAIYALIASGLAVSYTATGIFNFAYGAIAFVAALLFYELDTGLGWPKPLAFVLTVFVFCPALGVALNKTIFRPLATATDEAKIMCTVGVLVALPALALYLVQGAISTLGWNFKDPRLANIPPGAWRSPAQTHKLPFDLLIDDNQILVFVVAALVAVVLWYLLRRTRLGLQMRAVVDRPELAALRGIDERRTSTIAWIIGTTLAGLAGVVGAPLLGSFTPDVFNLTMFIAAAAVVLGRLRSVPLAFAGGILLGVAQALVFNYLPGSVTENIPGISNAVPFLLLFAGLLWLARDRSRRGGSVAVAPPSTNWTSDLPRWRVALPWGIVVAFFVLEIFVFLSDFWLGTMARGLSYAVIFLSFVIVSGQGGMVSLAQASFATMAAMVVGKITVEHGWPWGIALLAGMAAAVLMGVIVAIPALRVGGLPLALATLALGFVGDQVLFKWNWLRKSQTGWRLKAPALGPIDLNDRRTFLVCMMVLIALLMVLIHNLQRSASGRTIIAVRNSETAASTIGLSVPRSKLSLFALSSAIAGLGGVLVATRAGGINNGVFPTGGTLAWLASVVLFGIRKPQGAVIAGISFAASDVVLNNGFHFRFTPSFLHWDGLGNSGSSSTATLIAQLLFGLGAINLAREPDGILALTAAQNRARRDKRRAKTAAVTNAESRAASDTVSTAGASAARALPVDYRPTGQVALELVDVRSGYGLVEVLHGVSLTVPSGHITAVLGPNGAGKSTTCLTAAGRVPVRSGRILFGGEDVTGTNAPARARNGMVLAPESRGIFPGMSVRENLQIWLPSAADRQMVYDRFPILGERQTQAAGNLSGGEQQILTLASLLVNPPKVLIADEPSLGLAPLIVEQIMSLFVELRDRGSALLLVEEKARDLLNIADSVAVLHLGHVSWYGPRSEVDAERIATEYLGAIS